MKPWQCTVLASALLALAGCRSDPAIPILERQLRLQEDEIYRLRAALEESQDCSASSRQHRASDSRSTSDETEDTAPRHRRGSGATNGFTPPSIELPLQPATGVPDALKSPGSSLPSGVPEVPENLQRPSKPLRSGENRSNGPSLEKSADAASRPRHLMAGQSAAVPLTPAGDSRRVATIAINRTLTGGIGAEDQPGDQGLLVVIEPRDRAGRLVDAPADVSVVVLDPALQGEAMRVARWDFSAAETAAMFRRTSAGAAIHLTTAWPADPPAHNKLQLFVRYVTADGRKVQTDMPIEVALPGDKTARWESNGQPVERESAAESWQRDELPPTAGIPGHLPQTADRTNDTASRRPVWSPERR